MEFLKYLASRSTEKSTYVGAFILSVAIYSELISEESALKIISHIMEGVGAMLIIIKETND